VIEYLEGSTLKHRIEGKAMSLEQLVDFATQIADAMEVACERNHSSRYQAGEFICHQTRPGENPRFWKASQEFQNVLAISHAYPMSPRIAVAMLGLAALTRCRETQPRRGLPTRIFFAYWKDGGSRCSDFETS
jgi:hypothetical protein